MMTLGMIQRFSKSTSSLQIARACLSLDPQLLHRQVPTSHTTCFRLSSSSNRSRPGSSSLEQKKKQQQQNTVLPKKRLDVAIVGAPNAGKSQLLNALTQSQVAAVSRKRHTTRNGILGTRTVDDTQLVFVDTPGYLRSKSARKERLVRDLTASAGAEIDLADYTLVVIDAAKRIDDSLREALVLLMLRAINAKGRMDDSVLLHDHNDDANEKHGEEEEEVIVREKFAIVLNKVDLVNPKTKLLEIAQDIGALGDICVRLSENTKASEILMRAAKGIQDGEDKEMEKIIMQENENMTKEELEILAIQSPPIFYISALKNDGIEDVLHRLLQLATPCDESLIIPSNQITTMSPIERVEEVLREKIYRCLHKEVPHRVKQVNQSFRKIKEPSTGKEVIIIDHELVVKTKSHQRLVKGRGGMTLQRIKETAQRDLESVFECPVALNLHVRLSKTQGEMPLDASSLGVQEFKMW